MVTFITYNLPMDKLQNYKSPLLTKSGIRSLIRTLEKQKAELAPYFDTLTKEAETRYIDTVIERLDKCQTLRQNSYSTLLEDAFYEIAGKALHCEGRKEVETRLNSLHTENSFPNYVAFLQEYDLASVTPPDNMLRITNIAELAQNKTKVDSGFINYMRREKGEAGVEVAQHEIDLFTLNLEMGAIHSRGAEMAIAYTHEAKHVLGDLPYFR